MVHSLKTTLFFLLLVLLVSQGTWISRAETLVSGPVSGVWTTAGSPYLVEAPIGVPPGDSLRIEPGVQLLFLGPYPFQVFGRLCAAGAEAQPIIFARHGESPAPWQGIRFHDAAEGCFLDHCQISGAAVEGMTIEDGSGGGVYSANSSPTISHCLIEDCQSSFWDLAYGAGGAAIYCLGGEPRILDNLIRNCDTEGSCLGGGAICISASQVLISGNEIRSCFAHGCAGGIACYGTQVRIEHNRLFDCTGWHYGGGISLMNGCSGKLFDNLLAGNEAVDVGGGGIWIEDSELEISFCTMIANIGGTPEYGQGGGICFYGSDQPLISNSIIWGNSAFEGDQLWPMSLYFVSYCDVQGGWSGTGNLDADPLFVTGPEDDHYLSQLAAGQPTNSPCLDAGSGPAENFCVSSECAEVCLDQLTTRTDHQPDSGTADLGYHHGHQAEWCPLAAGLSCVPSSGTLPFLTTITVTLTNQYPSQARLFAAHLDCLLAGGHYFPNWRAGYTTVGGGESYRTSWSQSIPALGSLVGDNRFTLVAEDVTPAPFNLPPYPPSGDTDTSLCTVEGIAP